jgi:Fe-S oxidoreductase
LEELWKATEEGRDIVVPGPTCSYVIKRDYPALVPGEKAARVSERTYDICEYLMKLHREGELDRSFGRVEGTVAYHLPCHLKAQNIGYKSLDLLRLIPGLEVKLIEECSAMDGTWGMKKEYFDLSKKVATKLFRGIEEASPRWVVTDCPLAAIQIKDGIGREGVHPIQLVDHAYSSRPRPK